MFPLVDRTFQAPRRFLLRHLLLDDIDSDEGSIILPVSLLFGVSAMTAMARKGGPQSVGRRRARPRNPMMVGSFAACARATNGHAAAPPSSVMNSRRLMGLRPSGQGPHPSTSLGESSVAHRSKMGCLLTAMGHFSPLPHRNSAGRFTSGSSRNSDKAALTLRARRETLCGAAKRIVIRSPHQRAARRISKS